MTMMTALRLLARILFLVLVIGFAAELVVFSDQVRTWVSQGYRFQSSWIDLTNVDIVLAIILVSLTSLFCMIAAALSGNRMARQMSIGIAAMSAAIVVSEYGMMVSHVRISMGRALPAWDVTMFAFAGLLAGTLAPLAIWRFVERRPA